MKTNNNTLQEKALKLKKQRRNRIIASLLGIAILVWGVIEVAFLFLDYKQTGTSNDARKFTGEMYCSICASLLVPVCL